MNLFVTFLSVGLFLSLSFNVAMVFYAKNSLSRFNEVANTSENISEIFSVIDSYREHLNAVYEMPVFYGDETLQSLLEHTGQMIDFMKKYENVYSFTQPDLEEQLMFAVNDLEEEYEEEK